MSQVSSFSIETVTDQLSELFDQLYEILSSVKDKENFSLKKRYASIVETKESVERTERKVRAYFRTAGEVEYSVHLLIDRREKEEQLQQKWLKVQSLRAELDQIKKEDAEKLESLAYILHEKERDSQLRESRIRHEEETRLVHLLDDMKLQYIMSEKEREKCQEKSIELKLEVGRVVSDYQVLLNRSSLAQLAELEKEKTFLKLEWERLKNEQSLKDSEEMYLLKKQNAEWQEKIEKEELEIQRLTNLLPKSGEEAKQESDFFSPELVPDHKFEGSSVPVKKETQPSVAL